MEFFESRVFTGLLPQYLEDEEYRQLQSLLMDNPEGGAVMPGTGGFRKIRFSDRRRGKGKRGGLRVIYYFFPDSQQIWFVTLYSKDEMEDLNAAEKKAMREMIGHELEARQRRKHGKA